jgi:hypothetical protein
MIKKSRDVLFLLGIVILAITVGLIVNGNEKKEGFFPGLNAFYRPYARKIENYSSRKINNFTNFFTRFAKKCKFI